jgi:hypothetical protein
VLAAAREAIEMQDVQFIGNTAFDDVGHRFVPNPSPIDYGGATPDVDEAWKNLTLEGRTYSSMRKGELEKTYLPSLTVDIRTGLCNYARRSPSTLAH